MSYKVDFAAADVQWQILALKEFPKIANTHFYPAMHRAVRALKAEIVPTVPFRSGLARRTFKTQVSGNGLNIQARAGWFGMVDAWYINIVEYGARAHSILPETGIRTRRKRAFANAVSTAYGMANTSGVHINVKGRWVTKRNVEGFAARRFMKEGFENAKPDIDLEMLSAAEGVVNELAVK